MQLPATGLSAAVRHAWQPYRQGMATEPVVRAWLATALGCDPASVTLVRDVRGRPRLEAPQQHLDVSWSHSGEGLLMALGKGVEIGIDLERQRPRPRALEIAQRFFSAREAGWLAALPTETREVAFLRLWCAKEAVLKAHGHGLAFGLDKLAFVEHAGHLQLVECDRALGQPEDWSLHEFVPRPGYRAALAWRQKIRSTA